MAPRGPVQLYLIRHGVAEERGGEWPDDTKRPLTEAGMRRLRRSSLGLERLGVAFDVVMTSPLVRARQTADLIVWALERPAGIVVSDALAPGGALAAVVADIRRQMGHARVAVVGHEPGMGELAAHLIGASRPVAFKKGTACRIDLDDESSAAPGALRWLLTSKVLRRLGA